MKTKYLQLWEVSAPRIDVVCTSKRWILPASPRGVITQNTDIDDFIAGRTSNFKCVSITFSCAAIRPITFELN